MATKYNFYVHVEPDLCSKRSYVKFKSNDETEALTEAEKLARRSSNVVIVKDAKKEIVRRFYFPKLKGAVGCL